MSGFSFALINKDLILSIYWFRSLIRQKHTLIHLQHKVIRNHQCKSDRRVSRISVILAPELLFDILKRVALGTRMSSTALSTNVHRLLNHTSFISTKEIKGGGGGERREEGRGRWPKRVNLISRRFVVSCAACLYIYYLHISKQFMNVQSMYTI